MLKRIKENFWESNGRVAIDMTIDGVKNFRDYCNIVSPPKRQVFEEYTVPLPLYDYTMMAEVSLGELSFPTSAATCDYFYFVDIQLNEQVLLNNDEVSLHFRVLIPK